MTFVPLQAPHGIIECGDSGTDGENGNGEDNEHYIAKNDIRKLAQCLEKRAVWIDNFHGYVPFRRDQNRKGAPQDTALHKCGVRISDYLIAPSTMPLMICF